MDDDVTSQCSSTEYLAITSHESEQNFKRFYETLCSLCNMINIPFKPDYIAQDGCLASLNAINVFQNKALIVMCYFHVLKNVKEFSRKLTKNNFDMVLSDIKELHYSKNFVEYEVNKHNIQTKWFNYPELKDFTGYL
ncbi:unnamed protein product [Brachionus calyciflorus]|uniref:MULE transposase domain-containing protein n=1 Tax=Brachionus calyciflorus TaxID=104777 RepID=A0A814E4J7_9BILA|nr:unnamed protein product [Brachionus calyciflorus]